MGILAVYDIMGIQNFIFSSKELKENIGASLIVKNILSIDLPEVIGENTINSKLDWENSSTFKIKDSLNNIDAEVLYIGGGNALVAFKNEEIENKITREFSRRVFEKSYSLSIATAKVDTDYSSFNDDKEKLFAELDKNKNNYLKTMPLMGISITKQDLQTSLPISYEEKYRNLTREAYLKRLAIKNEINENEYISDKEKYIFTNEIDKLGVKPGESKIAIVHIDGNNMGDMINKVMEDISDYSQAVPKIRLLSKEIDKCYKSAYKNTIKFLEEKMETIKDNDKFSIYSNSENKMILPIRNIILNGDDVTFVCNAKLALSVVEKFLLEINNFIIPSFDNKLSACAGISIVGSHFPFSKAYDLAEECCSNAKIRAKVLKSPNTNQVLSWMDYHIVYSGLTADLNTIRDNMYQGSFKDDSEKLKNIKVGLKHYNLLKRPYLIDTNEANTQNNICSDNFISFKRIYTELSKKWPRTRLKKLREVLTKGPIETKKYLIECKTRGYILPEIIKDGDEKITGFLDDYISPYFDVIEMLDIYHDMGVE